MAAKLEMLEGNKAKLEIKVPAEKFEEGVKKAYQKMKGRFNVPGFRKGKAPRVIVENHYGPQVFYEEAFEEIFPETYQEAVEEHKLEVVSRPELDIVSMDVNDGVVYIAEVFLKPEVKLGKYEGIKVKKPVKKILAKDVDAEVEKTREQNARWVDVDRAAKNGDSVILDFSGSVDGVKFDGGTAEKQTLNLGSGNFIPGFEEQIVGMKAGDEKDIQVTFPTEYAPELAGKDAVFAIKVHNVREKELPQLDDDFAQDVSEFDTLAEYKKDIKKNLQKRNELAQKAEMENQLYETIAEQSEIDIPPVMVENEIDYQLQQLSYQLMYQGMKLEDYLNYAGITIDQLRENYRANAGQQVKMMLVVQALIDELKLEATDKEVEKRIEEQAKEAEKDLKEFKDAMREGEIDQIKNRIVMEKLYDLLIEKAKIEEYDPDKEAAEAKKKAPAKKAADKKADAKSDEKTEKKAPAKKAAAKPAEKKKTVKKADADQDK